VSEPGFEMVGGWQDELPLGEVSDPFDEDLEQDCSICLGPCQDDINIDCE
jgi:hypothetical protein